MSTIYESIDSQNIVEEIVETRSTSKSFTRERLTSGDRQKDLAANNPIMSESEKRLRREIANSNERRRMQSINAGFQSLRSLLPHHEGEKLSKAAILQQTAEYIYTLEQEKTRLLSQNCQLKRLLSQQENGGETFTKKRKTGIKQEQDGDETSTGVVKTIIPELKINALVYDTKNGGYTAIKTQLHEDTAIKRELIELRAQLEEERSIRAVLEEQLHDSANSQIRLVYPSSGTTYTTDEDGVVLSLVQNDDMEELQVMEVCDSMVVPPVAQTQTIVTTCESPIPTESSSRPDSPIGDDDPLRLPKALVDAMKAEPKVEVEEISAHPNIIRDEMISCTLTASPPVKVELNGNAQGARVYSVGNTSRVSNLETIVEAIRHLEGDHLFAEDTKQRVVKATQLRGTATSQQAASGGSSATVAIKPQQFSDATQIELNPYLQFHCNTTNNSATASANSSVQSSYTVQQTQRPGVIVVKQNS